MVIVVPQQLTHPENSIFSQSNKMFSGSKYPENVFPFILKTEALTGTLPRTLPSGNVGASTSVTLFSETNEKI